MPVENKTKTMTFVALDLETTGLDSKKDQIIEIALVRFDEKTFEIIDQFSTLVHPGMSIPELNANITGITDEMVESSPSFMEIREKVREFIGEDTIVGHNIQFDRGFLIDAGLDIAHLPFVDTFFLANAFLFKLSSISLDSLCGFFNISLDDAHRALADTMATIYVLEALLIYFEKVTPLEKELFHYTLSLSEDQNIQKLKSYIYADRNPQSFTKIKQILLEKIGLYKEKIFHKTPLPGSSSKYLKSLPSFETRSNQAMLIEATEKNLTEGGIICIEAPTGVGKTIGFCLPSIIYAVNEGKQVYISTKTKVLQDQMYYNDLKTLNEELKLSFNYVKIKGQENYISLFSFFKVIEQGPHSYPTLSFLSKIILWLYQTTSGELDELNYYSDEQKYVKSVHSKNEDISSYINPYQEYEFLYKSRKDLETAHIVVLNHAVLFNDIKNGGDITKSLEHLVIDEAHSVEDIATNALKRRYNKKELMYMFEDMFFQARRDNFTDAGTLYSLKETLFADIDLLEDLILTQLSGKYQLSSEIINILLQENNFFSQDIVTTSKKITQVLSDIGVILKTSSKFSSYAYILNEIVTVFDIVFDITQRGEYIQILTYSQYMGISLEYTELNTGKFFNNKLWKNIRSVILTSATLKVENTFEYMQNSLGLPPETTFLSLESDFDYSKQAKLVIVKNIGSIKNNFKQVSSFLGEFFTTVQGRTLALFTSFSLIRSVFFDLNFSLKSKKIILLAQGISGSKFRIIAKFKEKSENHIIIGTESFWEGVDIPGESLQYLIIHKFPFSVPSDPIFIARSTLYKDSFGDYAIPKAIIKLKQGMGRLIRTKQDTGTIFLLDDRVYSTTWGKRFLSSFPQNIQVLELSGEEIIKNFLKK